MARQEFFLISLLFSFHRKTLTDFFWSLCDVYEMTRQMFLKFSSFFRYIDRHELFFFGLCVMCTKTIIHFNSGDSDGNLLRCSVA